MQKTAQVEVEATEDGDENEEVFTSDEESVITVLTTETVEMETVALESRFVLTLDRKGRSRVRCDSRTACYCREASG